jgi:hypothetical protein
LCQDKQCRAHATLLHALSSAFFQKYFGGKEEDEFSTDYQASHANLNCSIRAFYFAHQSSFIITETWKTI